ncbi:uncharacterized protein LOC131254304 [Magnolia sinica]|uniref:uncharacterized protein LOC131254304 n=1 Tax=Magnolia sinica TaxID=86752 RepID=UPI0026598B9E|nr:uncharacterized protein LOC131254304 [Magnolia sinica]
MQAEAIRHFEEAFNSAPTLSVPDILSVIPSLVLAEDNDMLMKLPSFQETQQAVHSLPLDGMSGPDGFIGAFFSRCWDIIGSDIHKAAESFFRGENMPRAFTTTIICLIPKSLNPKKLSDFKPINLCNCIYKISAKIISSRLNSLLLKLISVEQGAFIKGRDIAKSIVLAQESIRDISRHVRGRNLVIKLNIKKAYGRVE